jgi:hypothetical protein
MSSYIRVSESSGVGITYSIATISVDIMVNMLPLACGERSVASQAVLTGMITDGLRGERDDIKWKRSSYSESSGLKVNHQQ